jgi:hypothetical protein
MPAGMICAFGPCGRPVTGPEDAKSVEVHRVGEELVPFGPGLQAGTVLRAEGPLVSIYHGACYWRHVKRLRLRAARSADPAGQPAMRRI